MGRLRIGRGWRVGAAGGEPGGYARRERRPITPQATVPARRGSESSVSYCIVSKVMFGQLGLPSESLKAIPPSVVHDHQ